MGSRGARGYEPHFQRHDDRIFSAGSTGSEDLVSDPSSVIALVTRPRRTSSSRFFSCTLRTIMTPHPRSTMRIFVTFVTSGCVTNQAYSSEQCICSEFCILGWAQQGSSAHLAWRCSDGCSPLEAPLDHPTPSQLGGPVPGQDLPPPDPPAGGSSGLRVKERRGGGLGGLTPGTHATFVAFCWSMQVRGSTGSRVGNGVHLGVEGCLQGRAAPAESPWAVGVQG